MAPLPKSVAIRLPKTPREHALEYVDRGWRVFPCRPADEEGIDPETGEVRITNHTFIPKGTTTTGRDYTPEETQAKLEEAITNTPVMPPVTKCPPGIAAGTACYSDQFIGGKIGSTGKGGAVQWYDVFAARQQQIEEREAHDALSTADKRALRAALTAASFEEVGVAAGLSPIYAKKGGGKARLLAANDNLDAALKKIAG